jgi:hypothetical protein
MHWDYRWDWHWASGALGPLFPSDKLSFNRQPRLLGEALGITLEMHWWGAEGLALGPALEKYWETLGRHSDPALGEALGAPLLGEALGAALGDTQDPALGWNCTGRCTGRCTGPHWGHINWGRYT